MHKVVRNQMVPSRAEWRGETDNRATPPVSYCPSTSSFSVRPYCKNARWDRCQEYHNCFLFRGLDVLELRGWRLSSKTWGLTISPWMRR